MPEQLTLPDSLEGAYRHDGHDTERAAARAQVVAGRGKRRRVLDLLARTPAGLTDYQIATALGMLRGSASKRRGELVEAGWVEDAGERRETDTGCGAIVWRLAPAAWSEWAALPSEEVRP